MDVNSYAKVNLYLKVGKRLKSGYHTIQSVMQLVKLHDFVSFEKLKEDEIIVESNNRDLEGKNNLAYKAAEILKNEFNIKEGIKINIEKNIPMAAGLGGGSSDAATALLILNKLWSIKTNQKKLIEIGAKIGSDVPFFIAGETAVVEGMGDKIKPVKKPISINVVLVNPGIKVSTTWAYKQLDKLKAKDATKKNVNEVVRAIRKKDIKKIAENMHNDFDALIEKKHSIVKEIKINFRKFDALNSMVVGSGPTVLGMYDSIYTAREAYFKLKDLYPFVYLTKTF
ncbi:4-(cytidine 5'-diphospho)-2-C-methyl-D-erythritol kinase [Candidatus Woesearchaeota archaeon]|jgi:4-diphosphocytidyl-2-C-methyl-D-erythritol kinase|nr:4-(cytidine 5'-diphospho)-2-C-methyl-D-erythritol kinase [Candidatus Woesearchaeota archaeon]|tara:strand:- start:16958 stop:17806 length:849 start_codon:yes stop_codon:yes gene_type:complete